MSKASTFKLPPEGTVDWEAEGEWLIYIDQPITRRKHFHVLVHPNGDVVFAQRLLSDVLTQLDVHGITRYQLVTLNTDDPSRGNVDCNRKGKE